ncbi:hypothetical protein NE237_013127 [Protea cynaroides]|uniref:DUF7890 domain-containing protein n=1 Tax=Protea cynaroides TaxID=273540 RepID=A0A9Q0JXI7_9MAGN|nr:hypothetical protein NE237_013127 [Protea cynaroides]
MGNCIFVGMKDDETVAGATKIMDQKFVCRDDLNKKSSQTKKEGELCVPEQRSSKRVVGSSGGVKRVKILLTKEEAALLLSNCKIEDGLLKFKLNQLQKVETTCTTNPNSDRRSWNPALESISEEF